MSGPSMFLDDLHRSPLDREWREHVSRGRFHKSLTYRGKKFYLTYSYPLPCTSCGSPDMHTDSRVTFAVCGNCDELIKVSVETNIYTIKKEKRS